MALTNAQIIAQYPGYATMDPNAIQADFSATGGAGKGPSTPSSPDSSGSVSSVDPNAAFSQAAGIVAPVDTSSLSSAAASIQADAKAKSDALTSEIPDTKNIYSTLAQQLKTTFDTNQGVIQKQGTQDVAKQQTSAAASGLSTTTGFEAALTRSIQKDTDTKLQTASDAYGVQATQLASEEAKDIKQLTADAADALLTGDTSVANINAQIIDIKQKQQDLITTAATAIMNAENKDDADYYKSLYQGELLDLKQQTIDLSAQKLADAEKNGTGGVDTTLTGGDNTTNSSSPKPPAMSAPQGVTQVSNGATWYSTGQGWIQYGVVKK